jgi:hypothetical protein
MVSVRLLSPLHLRPNMKNRLLFLALGGLLVATTGSTRSADFDVDRVTIRIADDAWESIGTSRRGLSFSGDRSGEIQVETRHLLLRDKSGKFRVTLTVSASRGVGTVHINWTVNCQPGKNMHVVDNTHGNAGGSDCLRVTGLIQTQRYLELAAPDMLAELTSRNVALPKAAYVVSDEAGLENGAMTFVRAVFASDFDLPTEASSRDTLPPAVKPESVAWGARLAEAVRSNLHSVSGTLVLPAVAKAN